MKETIFVLGVLLLVLAIIAGALLIANSNQGYRIIPKEVLDKCAGPLTKQARDACIQTEMQKLEQPAE